MTIRSQVRYQNQLRQVKLDDGRTVYATVRPKVIDTDVQDVIITADERDRADIIANNVYGSAQEWWRIASGNGKVDGSLHFTPGQQIIIPRKK
jgi:hypothetical protein